MAISKRFASEEYVNESYAPISHSHSWADSGEQTTYGDTLTWDGNTDGLVCIHLLEDCYLYKVSDVCPINLLLELGGHFSFLSDWDGSRTVDLSSEIINTQFTNAVVLDDSLVVVSEDGTSVIVEDVNIQLPEKGIYFKAGSDFRITSLTINGYNGFPRTEITPLPNKYLNIVETVGSDTLTWDGDIESLDFMPMADNYGFYHVSDGVFTPEDVENGGVIINEAGVFGTITFQLGEGVICVDVSDQFGVEMYALVMAANGQAVVGVLPNDSSINGKRYKKGTYFIKGSDEDGVGYIRSLTINGYTGFTKEQVKQEYLPSEYDMVLSVKDTDIGCATIDDITIISGSIEKVIDKINAKQFPKVKIQSGYVYGDDYLCEEVVFTAVKRHYDGDRYQTYCGGVYAGNPEEIYRIRVAILDDGTINHVEHHKATTTDVL